MGLFDFGSAPSGPKVFKTKGEIHHALMHIQSLDYKQRPVVMGALIRELDNGGVTVQELKETIRQLRKSQTISETDQHELLHLADHPEA